MLAQILKEMWVDPTVLEALGEEQRRILFLKMREEQVRRWREREEMEERESRAKVHARPRKGHSKRVSWLLGLDGNVCVHVIGEVDELRSSKLLKTLHNNRLQSADINGIQSESMSDRETFQPRIRLVLSGDSVTHCHGTSKDSEEEDRDSGSAGDDPKDRRGDSTDSEDPRGDSTDSDSGSGADDPKDWGLIYRPHPRRKNLPSFNHRLSITDQLHPQDRVMVNPENGEKNQMFGSRVAKLRRAFAESSNSRNISPKPPVPSKPLHLTQR